MRASMWSMGAWCVFVAQVFAKAAIFFIIYILGLIFSGRDFRRVLKFSTLIAALMVGVASCVGRILGEYLFR